MSRKLERTVHNHLSAAQQPDGAGWSYYTPLNGYRGFDAGTSCCISSGPRGWRRYRGRWRGKGRAPTNWSSRCIRLGRSASTALGAGFSFAWTPRCHGPVAPASRSPIPLRSSSDLVLRALPGPTQPARTACRPGPMAGSGCRSRLQERGQRRGRLHLRCQDDRGKILERGTPCAGLGAAGPRPPSRASAGKRLRLPRGPHRSGPDCQCALPSHVPRKRTVRPHNDDRSPVRHSRRQPAVVQSLAARCSPDP